MKTEQKAEMTKEIKCKVLMHGDTLIDSTMLCEGLYQTSVPCVYSLDTTMNILMDRGRSMQDKLGTPFVPQAYFDNLIKCELIEVTFLSDLRSVIRGELIRYERKKHYATPIFVIEEDVDEFLNNNQ